MIKYAIGFFVGVMAASIFFTFKLKTITTEEAKPSNDALVEETPMDESDRLPEDFETFYLKFHQDSIYQIEHVLFPLRGMPANADSLLRLTGNFHWEAENWKMHQPFNSDGGAFSRDFLSMGDIITEEIYTKEGFGMQRRFMKTNGDWFLIFYSAMNKIR